MHSRVASPPVDFDFETKETGMKTLIWYSGYVAATALAFASAGAPAHPAQGSSTAIKSVQTREPEVGDLASLLRVQKIVTDFALQGKTSRVAARMEFYRGGKKIQETTLGPVAASGNDVQGKFAILIADLDYLPLGGGKPGTCRLDASLSSISGESRSYRNASSDLPKDVMDLSKFVGGGTFAGRPSDKGEFALYWRIANSGDSVSATTPEGVLEKNPKADLMIVFLKVE